LTIEAICLPWGTALAPGNTNVFKSFTLQSVSQLQKQLTSNAKGKGVEGGRGEEVLFLKAITLIFHPSLLYAVWI